MKELNDYPNYIYIFLNHLVAPSTAMFAITSVLFNKKELRKTLKEEMQHFMASLG
jgi:hypothetical protein